MDTVVAVVRAEDLGPALREERLRLGLTQTEVAEAAAVGRPWLNQFEGGRKPGAPLDMVMRVANALSVTVSLEREPSQEVAVALPVVDLDELLAGYRL
ncbi:helix-turn-helix domain-containing protein [Scrofimicrobium canadense]|nr:helix-turn-helix domain-containing protein [Scrofimicrobium canadense]